MDAAECCGESYEIKEAINKLSIDKKMREEFVYDLLIMGEKFSLLKWGNILDNMEIYDENK